MTFDAHAGRQTGFVGGQGSAAHASWVTPMSFEAMPRSVRDEVVVLSSGLAVGLVMMAVGAVARC
jgi:hypothetical protein